ncbi:hypothetical protein [Fluviibacterium sp. S390]|uniref:hypothetical protein n=1 Tax=Fluviibacterium sp. S390 TaxID=3415139 RepID=UPI003C7A930A
MRIWTAKDLARDLGYKNATPAFWRWCESKGLEPLHDKPFAFDYDAVRRVLGSL